MRTALVTLAFVTMSLIGITDAKSQADSCAEATPFEFYHCETFPPPFPQAVTLCYSFITGGSAVDFGFGYFAFCSDLNVTYTLYDASCDTIGSNPDGSFGVEPGTLYIVCGTVECLSVGGISQVCTTEQLTLPVELLGMIAFPTDMGVVIQWTTATEWNSRSFEILRSRDLVDWDRLCEVPASGSTSSERVYRWTDADPLPGLVYYQLRGVDLDGGETMLMYLPVTWYGRKGSSLGPFDLLGRRVR